MKRFCIALLGVIVFNFNVWGQDPLKQDEGKKDGVRSSPIQALQDSDKFWHHRTVPGTTQLVVTQGLDAMIRESFLAKVFPHELLSLVQGYVEHKIVTRLLSLEDNNFLSLYDALSKSPLCHAPVGKHPKYLFIRGDEYLVICENGAISKFELVPQNGEFVLRKLSEGVLRRENDNNYYDPLKIHHALLIKGQHLLYNEKFLYMDIFNMDLSNNHRARQVRRDLEYWEWGYAKSQMFYSDNGFYACSVLEYGASYNRKKDGSRFRNVRFFAEFWNIRQQGWDKKQNLLANVDGLDPLTLKLKDNVFVGASNSFGDEASSLFAIYRDDFGGTLVRRIPVGSGASSFRFENHPHKKFIVAYEKEKRIAVFDVVGKKQDTYSIPIHPAKILHASADDVVVLDREGNIATLIYNPTLAYRSRILNFSGSAAISPHAMRDAVYYREVDQKQGVIVNDFITNDTQVFDISYGSFVVGPLSLGTLFSYTPLSFANNMVREARTQDHTKELWQAQLDKQNAGSSGKALSSGESSVEGASRPQSGKKPSGQSTAAAAAAAGSVATPRNARTSQPRRTLSGSSSVRGFGSSIPTNRMTSSSSRAQVDVHNPRRFKEEQEEKKAQANRKSR